MKQQKGFSLIELMIAVVIISILTSIAIPSYQDYIVRSRIPEATSGMADIRVRLEQFYQDNRSYPIGGCVVAPTAPSATQLSVPAGSSFDFACTATATAFSVTASGKNAMAGFSYTLDQQNNRTTTFSGLAASKGWTSAAPNNCWVTRKGGKCI
jgi:type IV pilus assembly protein PilE